MNHIDNIKKLIDDPPEDLVDSIYTELDELEEVQFAQFCARSTWASAFSLSHQSLSIKSCIFSISPKESCCFFAAHRKSCGHWSER